MLVVALGVEFEKDVTVTEKLLESSLHLSNIPRPNCHNLIRSKVWLSIG